MKEHKMRIHTDSYCHTLLNGKGTFHLLFFFFFLNFIKEKKNFMKQVTPHEANKIEIKENNIKKSQIK